MTGYRPFTILNWIAEAIVSARGTILRSFHFTGRSRRTEVLYFWLVAGFATGVFPSAFDGWLDWKQRYTVDISMQALLALPLFALFVRRFHDMGVTGWLIVPTIVTAAMNLHKSYWYRFTPPDIMISGHYPLGGAIGLLALPGVILAMTAVVGPGNAGDNRFGPDPRAETATDTEEPTAPVQAGG